MSQTRPTSPGTLAGELRLGVSRLVRKLRKQRGQADLPEHQFVVLTSLNKFGPMTPGALADLEGVRPPSMTRTVNALVELGLVSKLANDQDKRQVTVHLTPHGRNEVRETRRRRDAWLTKQLGSLSPQERQILAEASELLNRIAGH